MNGPRQRRLRTAAPPAPPSPYRGEVARVDGADRDGGVSAGQSSPTPARLSWSVSAGDAPDARPVERWHPGQKTAGVPIGASPHGYETTSKSRQWLLWEIG